MVSLAIVEREVITRISNTYDLLIVFRKFDVYIKIKIILLLAKCDYMIYKFSVKLLTEDRKCKYASLQMM